MIGNFDNLKVLSIKKIKIQLRNGEDKESMSRKLAEPDTSHMITEYHDGHGASVEVH